MDIEISRDTLIDSLDKNINALPKDLTTTCTFEILKSKGKT